MNSTEFYIAVGEAICQWGKTHNEDCVLDQMEGIVVCLPTSEAKRNTDPALLISKKEIAKGLPGWRWTQIGAALYNLYRKEIVHSKAIES